MLDLLVGSGEIGLPGSAAPCANAASGSVVVARRVVQSARRVGSTACLSVFGGDLGVGDELGEARRFALDEALELRRVHGRGLAAQLLQSLDEVGVLQRLRDGGIELLHD